MFVYQGARILKILLEMFAVADHLVAEVKLGIERYIYDVDPVWLGHAGRIGYDLRIHGIFESLWKVCVELPVSFFGQVNPEIPPWLRGEVGVTCAQRQGEKQDQE